MHLLIVPVIEAPRDQRCLAIVHRQALLIVSLLPDCLLVILDLLSVFLTSDCADARCPQENGEDVRVATPALSLFVGLHLPLAHTAHDVPHA